MQNDSVILLPVDEAIALFPTRNGRPPHVKSVLRRIRFGVRGVMLRGVKHSGRWYTSAEWVQQYLDEYTQRWIQPTRIEFAKRSSDYIKKAEESLSRRMRRGKGKG